MTQISQFLTDGLSKLHPAIQASEQIYIKAEPYIEALITKFWLYWALLQPYHPEEFLPAIAGILLIFFLEELF